MGSKGLNLCMQFICRCPVFSVTEFEEPTKDWKMIKELETTRILSGFVNSIELPLLFKFTQENPKSQLCVGFA